MTTWLGQFLMCYVVAPITVAALLYLAFRSARAGFLMRHSEESCERGAGVAICLFVSIILLMATTLIIDAAAHLAPPLGLHVEVRR